MQAIRTFVLRDQAIKHRCLEFIGGLPEIVDGIPIEIVVRELVRDRTVAQNRRYWAVITEISEQLWVGGHRYTKDQLHEEFKKHFIGADEYVGLDGAVHMVPYSTTKLSTKEFNEYMTQVEAWAVDVGVVFSDETLSYITDV